MDLPSISNAELSVLQALWERGQATIRDLTDALYPSGAAPQYATVQKLLDRLEAKACVTRDRSSRAHSFQATFGRDDFIGSRLQALADKVCGGSLTPIVTHLVQARRLTQRERESLRALVHEQPKGKGKT